MSKSSKQSAGLLMYRRVLGHGEVFLVHPGGPYWSQKNEGFWTIPKGEFEGNEERSLRPSANFGKRPDSKLLNPILS
ncbi:MULTISPECIES: hypothetical protein [Acidobacteriaceae]|uniref:hypothetical protein n=1 Tax=Acidobacteriaceae TaxID=204434 RepID=UPI0020B13A30|nr:MULTISPECIES: hypothetical protein [Acidobacteriaceae]MDW5266963.1 hypothetical protein [Edaphobacter sp.]